MTKNDNATYTTDGLCASEYTYVFIYSFFLSFKNRHCLLCIPAAAFFFKDKYCWREKWANTTKQIIDIDGTLTK